MAAAQNTGAKKVFFKKLVLCGFGCYKERSEFTFAPGLNNLVVSNERGKSTAVAGLAAVLFGLPNSSDPGRFGKAKYRSWEESGDFYGEVHFEAGGGHYRVRRHFDTDRVSLERLEGESWVAEAGGEHRPRARRRNVTYEDAIAHLTGLSSRDLFLNTFCVGQPLGEVKNLDRGVQQLLAGAGSSGAEALSVLEGWLENITRSTGQLGVTSRDKREDRQLEKIVKQREELEREIVASMENAAALHAVREELQQLDMEKKSIEEEIEGKRGLLEAWNRWRQMAERYEAAVAEQQRLFRAGEEVRRLEECSRALEEEAIKKWPEFCRSGSGAEAEALGKEISRLAELEKEAARLRTEVKKAEREEEELKDKMAAAEKKLKGPLAAGAGRPHLWRDYEELVRASAELAALESEERELVRQEEAALEVLRKSGHWAEIEPGPFGRCRQAADRVLEQWQELNNILERLKEKEEELHTKYSPFEGGSEEWRCACRDYHLIKADLEKRVRESRAEYESAARRLAEREEEHQNFRRQFADLEGAPVDALEVIDSRLALEKELENIKGEERRIRERTLGRVKIAAAGCAVFLAAAAALWSLKAAALAVGAALAAALAAGTFAVFSWQQGMAGSAVWCRQAEEAERKLAGMAERLGRLGSLPAKDLPAVRERLRLYQELKEILEEKAKSCPSQSEVSELLARAKSEEEAFLEWKKQLEPAFSLGEDPAAAFRRWHSLREEAERLKSQACSIAAKLTGAAPEEAARLSLDKIPGEDWDEVRRLAKAAKADLKCVGEAVLWLGDLTADQWKKWEEEWQEYRRAKGELSACALKRESHKALDAGGYTRKDRLLAEIKKLQQAIYPLTADTPADTVKALAEECRSLEKEMEVMRAGAARAAAERQHLERKLVKVEAERRALVGALQDVLAAAQGSAQTALERWEAWQKSEEERKKLAAGRAAALSTLNAASLEELEKKVIDASNAAQQLRGQWQSLVDAHPGLPPLEAAGRREHLEKEYTQLKAGLQELENKKRSLEEKIYEKTMHRAGLEGQRIINIALAEEKVKQLKEEEERLKLEAEALAFAHREMSTARREYGAAYRRRLEEAASRYFAALTQKKDRRVVVDEDFCVLVGEKLDGGREKIVLPVQLSQGAQDQLQIALRLAIADLLAGDYVLPLIFDDPFLNFDEDRLGELRATLERAAQERQLLVLSHREDYRLWGVPVRAAVTAGT